MTVERPPSAIKWAEGADAELAGQPPDAPSLGGPMHPFSVTAASAISSSTGRPSSGPPH